MNKTVSIVDPILVLHVMSDDNLHRGAHPQLFHYARDNRALMTKAEKILWNSLRNRKLNGYKFRRQHPLDSFIADFYCVECNLVVEVDGDYHKACDQKAYDDGRTYVLEGLNVKVIRFTNKEVLEKLDFVLTRIASSLSQNDQ